MTAILVWGVGILLSSFIVFGWSTDRAEQDKDSNAQDGGNEQESYSDSVVDSHPTRDFNQFAKFCLVLSMYAISMQIIMGIVKIAMGFPISVINGTSILGMVFNAAILIAGILTFKKNRFGLIALVVLFIARFFLLVPMDTGSYSYFLGGNLVHLFRDFVLFAIAMCFKKNGVSGWKSMLSSEIQHESSTIVDCNSEPVIKQDYIETNFTEAKEVSDSMQEQKELSQNTTEENDTEVSEVQSNIIAVPITESKKEIPAKNIEKENSSKRKKSTSVMVLIILLLVLSGVGIGLVTYVNSQEYPKIIEGFSNKFKYCFSISNNKLAKIYFEKYRKASNAGLDDLSLEFLEATWDTKANNADILDSIGSTYSRLAQDCEDKTLSDNYYKKAERAILEGLKANPKNKHMKKRLSAIYYNTHQDDKAKKIVEQILFENPEDDFAIYMMCIIYNDKHDWDNLLRWGDKGYKSCYDNRYRANLIYLYAKGLYETGRRFDAMKYYAEAEEKDPNNRYHKEFQKVGGVTCSITSLAVENTYEDGKVINKAGETIYEDNTCYLCPVLTIKTNRKGDFKFDIKLYEYKEERYYDHMRLDYYNRYSWELRENSSTSPSGYTYSHEIKLIGEEQKNIKLGGWGSNTPGYWGRGKYRFEIWWEGEMLYSKVFNIY